MHSQLQENTIPIVLAGSMKRGVNMHPAHSCPRNSWSFILTAAWTVGLGMGAEHLRQAGLKFWGLEAVGNRSEDEGCGAASWEETV